MVTKGLIGAVRNIRGEMGLGNARLLPVLLQKQLTLKSTDHTY